MVYKSSPKYVLPFPKKGGVVDPRALVPRPAELHSDLLRFPTGCDLNWPVSNAFQLIGTTIPGVTSDLVSSHLSALLCKDRRDGPSSLPKGVWQPTFMGVLV